MKDRYVWGFQIVGPECGRDQTGVFYCRCGACMPLRVDVSKGGKYRGDDCGDGRYEEEADNLFKSKRVKALEAEIDRLNSELWAEREKSKASAYVETAGLPKCKSLACINCCHIAYQDFHGRIYILGCGKDKRCSDFSPTNHQIPEVARQELQEGLLRCKKEGV